MFDVNSLGMCALMDLRMLLMHTWIRLDDMRYCHGGDVYVARLHSVQRGIDMVENAIGTRMHEDWVAAGKG